jgi:hypothetical protein
VARNARALIRLRFSHGNKCDVTEASATTARPCTLRVLRQNENSGRIYRGFDITAIILLSQAEGADFDADHAEQNFAEKAVNIGEGDSLTSAWSA